MFVAARLRKTIHWSTSETPAVIANFNLKKSLQPFVLTKPGRLWIFGGELSRVEGRNVRQYWTLLFSDLLLFAKVSRDRVLFIIEDPLPLVDITEMSFNVRKKGNVVHNIIERERHEEQTFFYK